MDLGCLRLPRSNSLSITPLQMDASSCLAVRVFDNEVFSLIRVMPMPPYNLAYSIPIRFSMHIPASFNNIFIIYYRKEIRDTYSILSTNEGNKKIVKR
jgi:hypothetical protein